MNKEQHRKSLKKTPVILIHGNAANVVHPMFGWTTMKQFLQAKDIGGEGGYQDCEIWAMDYLGENNFQTDMPNPVQDHIDDVRDFIDSVMAYLNVQRVDIICHSLGGMMTTAYMRGFNSDGTWDNSNNRLDKVGTVVFLATASHGLGENSVGEFQTGSNFETNSHIFKGVKDDTPRGVNDPNKMVGPNEESRTFQRKSKESQGASAPKEMFVPERGWKVTTEQDVGTLPPQVVYVAIIAEGDFVDQQNIDTGLLVGADFNRRFNLGPSIIGHEQILKQRGVFDAFKGYLSKYPPGIPASVIQKFAASPVSIRVSESYPYPKAVSETGESFPKPLSVTLNVTPADMVVSYASKRVTKEYQAGYIIENITEACKGKLRSGEALNLSREGIWEITFSGPGTSDVKRVYGVSVAKPTLEITPITPKFTDSLEVQAKTSSGRLYYSLDGMHYNEGDRVKISQTYTVYFIAIDKGNASEVVYRFYEKEAE
jgi:pimeloyl-ACP methyl ester carboxylesterase